MTTSKTPDSERAHATALFRYGVISQLVGTDFDHGELRATIKELASRRWRPPGSPRTRTYGASTIERWLYRYRTDGFDSLLPVARSDRGAGSGPAGRAPRAATRHPAGIPDGPRPA